MRSTGVPASFPLNSDGSELLAAGLWQADKVQWSPSHMSTEKIQIEETNSCLLALAGLKLLLLLSPITDARTWVIGLQEGTFRG